MASATESVSHGPPFHTLAFLSGRSASSYSSLSLTLSSNKSMYGQGPIREWMGGGTAGNSQGPSGKINLRASIYFKDQHNQSSKRTKIIESPE